MSDKGLILLAIGILVFLAHLFSALFARTRVPNVVYLILIGILLGPLLQILEPADFGKVGGVFVTVALVVILFHGGLELGFETLKVSLRPALILTLVAYAITLILLVPLCMLVAGTSFKTSLFIGAVLAGPAPALVIPMVQQLPLSSSTKTGLTLESALGEAICFVISLAALNLLREADVRVGELIGDLIASFLLAALIGALGGVAWSFLLNRIRQLQHALFTTPAFVFIVFGLVQALGYSGPVAALVFGITMGNSRLLDVPILKRYTELSPLDHDETEIKFFGELVFLLKTFFFVYLGITFTLSDFTLLIPPAILVGGMFVARYATVMLAGNRLGDRSEMALIVALIPRGTAAAVLGSLPLQLALPDGAFIQSTIYSGVILSILLSGLIVTMLSRFGRATAAQGGSDGAAG
jgi:NhaP-type Na+/H+ or K+/H+ antiporter